MKVDLPREPEKLRALVDKGFDCHLQHSYQAHERCFKTDRIAGQRKRLRGTALKDNKHLRVDWHAILLLHRSISTATGPKIPKSSIVPLRSPESKVINLLQLCKLESLQTTRHKTTLSLQNTRFAFCTRKNFNRVVKR